MYTLEFQRAYINTPNFKSESLSLNRNVYMLVKNERKIKTNDKFIQVEHKMVYLNKIKKFPLYESYIKCCAIILVRVHLITFNVDNQIRHGGKKTFYH